jgi:hypothetical protein
LKQKQREVKSTARTKTVNQEPFVISDDREAPQMGASNLNEKKKHRQKTIRRETKRKPELR